MLITPAAKLYHFHSPAGREGLMDTGFKQTYNRCRIFDEHGEVNAKNLTCFIWAMVGYVLGMMGKRRYGLAIGNVKGIICFLKDKIFLRQRT
ncbi:hypothetical protein DAMNIGENAA_08440 [Desulforhabdus amnigena]|uniref:Uncharacterized protein n=1 Tax=Desulforhabdus amnigena TaxID=40218 RepID=A0A9W6FTJ1_9BACT|nr:hypothetical protein DAMNIGENAA_08440 [Desulforhabdus amnigena]